ncbi:MAG TPA: hypothetical protein VL283_02030 [Candidatus Baltobacteraceae bacterium]|nr:hypothetical protein [Candidatus Baltobacteraceae bacterium]
MEATIMRVHQIQNWFLQHRGMPMALRPCGPCGKERMFTIWADGKYHCLQCLYGLTWRFEPDAVSAVGTSLATMEEFSASWLAYVKRIEAYEEPWRPSHSAIMKLAHISRLRPPPVCEVGECPVCAGLRPFMRREDGDGGCIYCLMQGRIVELEIEVVQEHAAA